MFERASREVGHVGVVVNNAIWYEFLDPTQQTVDGFEKTFNVGVTAIFHAMQAALPGMTELGGGVIVNIASLNAYATLPQLSAYAAAKAAVVALTRGLRAPARAPRHPRRLGLAGLHADARRPALHRLAVGRAPRRGDRHRTSSACRWAGSSAPRRSRTHACSWPRRAPRRSPAPTCSSTPGCTASTRSSRTTRERARARRDGRRERCPAAR